MAEQRRKACSPDSQADHQTDSSITQTLITTRTFLQRLELAYLYPADIRRLLEQSGFEDVRIAGGFSGQPFANDADELVVEATRVG